MSDRVDAVVIGAGANGLTAAAYLGKAGLRVTVVEALPEVGGLAGSLEFHPGYRGPGPLHGTESIRPWVLEELQLASHGVRRRERSEDRVALDGAGGQARLTADMNETAELLDRLAPGDGAAWRRYHEDHEPILGILRGFVDEQPVDLIRAESMGLWELARRALRVRRLGRRDMMELLRVPALSVSDALGEYFNGNLLKAALGLPAVAGNFTGPRAPGSNLNLLLDRATAGPGLEGGSAALIAGLERCARSHGVTIRTGARMEEVQVDGERVRGIRLADGEELEARRVLSSIHPARLFLNHIAPGRVPWRLQRHLETYRSRGTTSQVLLALDGEPEFRGADRPVHWSILASDLDAVEKACDPVKYRAVGHQPVLECRIQEAESGGGRVASVLVHFTPFDREPAWDDASRERLGDRVVEILEEHAPGLRHKVQGRLVRTPVDLAERYGLDGGQIHHGEQALDQILVRPVPDCSRYSTPLGGLFLCGSGSHPGGGLTCAPGGLAAKAVLSRARSA